MQDRCTNCIEHTICFKIYLEAPNKLLDDVCHIESHLVSLEIVLVSVKIVAWLVPSAP